MVRRLDLELAIHLRRTDRFRLFCDEFYHFFNFLQKNSWECFCRGDRALRPYRDNWKNSR